MERSISYFQNILIWVTKMCLKLVVFKMYQRKLKNWTKVDLRIFIKNGYIDSTLYLQIKKKHIIQISKSKRGRAF